MRSSTLRLVVSALAALCLVAAVSSFAAASPGIHIPPVVQSLAPPQPGVCGLQASQSSVTVCWYDRSTNEQEFVLYKRDRTGTWQDVYKVPSSDSAGYAVGNYYYVDNDTSVSGQCYMIAAVNQYGAGDTQEECTVRPDPSAFPQVVPANVKQWYGLSRVNDGTGDLSSGVRNDMSLVHKHERFGVDLQWYEGSALWRIEAQGGPQIMEGQAVALRVWGGGWLEYGHETWGVDLVLSNTPSYEWHVVGDPPGTPIGDGEFALWDSRANAFLTGGYQTWGVSLSWVKPAASSGSNVHDASVIMTAQPPVQGYVPFLGYLGGGPGNSAVLTKVWNSPYGVTLLFIKPGYDSQDCGNQNAVVVLGPNQTLTPQQMQTLWGSPTPSLAQRLPFLVCADTQTGSVSVNVEYRG